jgi:hypothetical protein
MAMRDRGARFSFGPLDRRGFLLGLRGGQVAILAGGFASTALLFSTLRSSVISLGIAMAVLALGTTMAFVPVGGRQLDEWMPILVRWCATWRPGGRAWKSTAHQRGHRLRVAPVEIRDDAQPILPATLNGISLLRAPIRSGELGVIRDDERGHHIALIKVSGGTYALLSDEEKAHRLAAWGAALASFAHRSTPLARVQLVVRTITEDSNTVMRYFDEARTVEADSPAAASYTRLVEAAAPVTQSQEVLIAVAINRRRASRAIKAAGGGDTGAALVLSRVAASLQAQLERADVHVDGALTPRLVAQVLREGWDPTAARGLRQRGDEGIPFASAGPRSTQTRWRSYVTDGGIQHATYWLSEWPRVDVGPNFLVPLLLQTHAKMTFSVTMAPVDPARAIRDLEVAQTAHISDQMLRDQHGFRNSTRREREADAIGRRERELADGHAEYRFSGYITVSGASDRELETACGKVEEAATLCRLDLRAMDGMQDVAFSYSLPLCRGLG